MKSLKLSAICNRLLLTLLFVGLFFIPNSNGECPPGIFSFFDFDEQHIEYPTVLSINAGGGNYTDWMGNAFIADQNYSGGNVGSTDLPIGGTTDDLLYQSERYGNFSYALPLTNGNYFVVFKFVETKWNEAGKRVFDVWMDGKKVITSLDIYNKVGKNWSYDVGMPVSVAGGLLQIEFSSIIDSAQVSAIRIIDLNDVNNSTVTYNDYIQSSNATCHSNCPSITEGINNNGQEFNIHLNTGLNVPGGQYNWMRGSDFSIEFWVKKNIPCSGLSAEQEVIIGKYSTNSSWSIGLGCDAVSSKNGRLVFELSKTGNTPVKYWGTKSLIDGRWHHVAFLRDGTNGKVRLYLDGQVEIEQTSVTLSDIDTSNADINIGWLNNGNGFHFTGSIDELAIYEKTLSEQEIKSHYFLARGYCTQCTTSIKIMPLGDSITQGTSSGTPDLEPYNVSYRKDLWEKIRGVGYDADFVGSLKAGYAYAGNGFDAQHEGHPGWRSAEIASNLFSWLTATNPEVILLHIGTNDPTDDVQYIENILDTIDGFNENISVVLAQIINVSSDCAEPWCNQWRAKTTSFNQKLKVLVQGRVARGDKILIVDQETGAGLNYRIYPNGDFWDSLHPYATGYTKMANVWATALDTFLPVCASPSPKIISTPVSEGEVGIAYYYNVNAFGTPNPTYELVTAPTGMNMDPVTGCISWTPAQEGSVSVKVKATNNLGFDLQSFTISVKKSGFPVILSNSGGGSYTDGQGGVYGADQYFSGGNVATVSSPIDGTTDDVLYQSERYGEFSYALPLANGNYTVVLKFAEIYYDVPGGRVFDVWMENQKVISSLDIYAQVGQNRAYDVVLPVSVVDGALNLQFSKIVDLPKVSAIVVSSGDPVVPPPNLPTGYNLNTGGGAYTDGQGGVYGADQYFSGGKVATISNPIDGTVDDVLYQSERFGEFSYALPLANGNYTVVLKFAEIYYDVPGGRVFDVWMENQKVISSLDIYSQVGQNRAYDVVLPVSVVDGVLNLQFSKIVDLPKVSAIVVSSGDPVVPPPNLPTGYNLNTGGGAYTDGQGGVYGADQYFSGGKVATISNPIDGTVDDVLYQSERFGEFSYALPLANGNYTVVLKFAEIYYDVPGGRVFDVWMENQKVISSLDIYSQVGQNRAYDVVLPVSVVDGVLNLQFSKIVDLPKVSAIVVSSGDPVVPPPNLPTGYNLNTGGGAYTDGQGGVYGADQYFSGGKVATISNPIDGTVDDVLYQSERFGEFSYALPLANGNYTVVLKFAEIYYDVPGGRVFDVWMENQKVISSLDIYSQVGQNRAYDVVLPVSVVDGVLNLQFSKIVDLPKVSAIVVSSGDPVVPPPNLPTGYNLNTGGGAYTDGQGGVYGADQYFSGGKVATISNPIDGTVDDVLYQSERFGEFSYALPLANGNYTVVLKFAEIYWEAVGQRVFDVWMENQMIISNLDIYAQVGKNRTYDVVLPVSVVDGVLNLQFSKIVDLPKVSAIVVQPGTL